MHRSHPKYSRSNGPQHPFLATLEGANDEVDAEEREDKADSREEAPPTQGEPAG